MQTIRVIRVTPAEVERDEDAELVEENFEDFGDQTTSTGKCGKSKFRLLRKLLIVLNCVIVLIVTTSNFLLTSVIPIYRSRRCKALPL